MRTVVFILLASTPFFVGCSPSAAPACSISSPCALGEVCVDGTCRVQVARDGAADASSDASSDAGTDASADASADAAPLSDGGRCVTVGCGSTEVCYDGLDNDCNGEVDDGCGCAPGSTSRCLPARTDPSASLCGWGEMRCEGTGEFGSWGACTGAGAGGGAGSAYGCRRIGIMGAPGANPSSNFQSWLETQGAIVTRFQASPSAGTLRREELETFDLVIVDWLQRIYSAEESATLTRWVMEGGSLMVMTGHDSGATADRHLSLLASLGPTFDLGRGALNGPATLLPHPTTMTADGTGTLPPLSFYGGLRTVVPSALSSEIVPFAVIGSDTVGVAGPLGTGKVLLFGDEWIEFDSEWSTMPPIVQFWLNTVTWMSPDTSLPICT